MADLAIAEIVNGVLRWHIPHEAYSVPLEYCSGTHLLYTQKALDPAMAAARKVVEAFEALGRAQDVAAVLQARAHCENTMTALKEVLGHNERMHA